MRVEFRSCATTMLLVAGLATAVVSCGSGPGAGGPAPAPPAAPPPAASPAPALTDQDHEICRAYAKAAPSARTPLDAMRTQEVLVPFINLIQLGTNQVATRAGAANSPAIAAAMREVVAAQEDVDAQGNRALPSGADIAETPVRLDPTRLTAALDAADRACAPALTQ